MENSTIHTILLLLVGVCALAVCVLLPMLRRLEIRHLSTLAATGAPAPRRYSGSGTSGNQNTASSGQSAAERATRMLIGDEAYEHMHARVTDLISHHRSDSAADVWLAAAPDDDLGRRRLHTLLPGMPLSLKDVSTHGVRAVEVYSDNICVGRLMLTEAEKALAISSDYRVTGTYVAEQNAYGDSDELSLKIVMFYRKPDSAETSDPVIPSSVDAIDNSLPALSHALDSEYKHIVTGEHPMVFYQN